MAVRIRLKRLGRRHRPFYRVCAMDQRTARNGRVIEELGTYDPMIADTDARVKLKAERVDYWLSVGAQPSDNVRVFIKKYGTNGTHLEAQAAAVERLQTTKPTAPPPVAIPKPKSEEEVAAEAAAAEAEAAAAEAEAAAVEGAADEATPEATAEAPAEAAPEATAEAPAEAAPADAPAADAEAKPEGE